MRRNVVVLACGMSLIAASLAAAQDVKIQAPPGREPRPEAVTPAHPYDQTRPSDRDFYPDGPRVEHDPAFVEGMSTEYTTPDSSGRMGVSAWTAPNIPVGPAVIGYRDVTGWAALGFTVTWGGPPPPRTTPRPPAR